MNPDHPFPATAAPEACEPLACSHDDVETTARGAWLYHLLKLALGGLFILAGVLKLLDPKAFARALSQYDLLPEILLPVVAVGLPLIEVAAGAGLIFEVRGCLTAIAGMVAIFLLVLVYAVALDLDIDCGCFSLEELGLKNSVRAALIRDLCLIPPLVYLYWWRRRNLRLGQWIFAGRGQGARTPPLPPNPLPQPRKINFKNQTFGFDFLRSRQK